MKRRRKGGMCLCLLPPHHRHFHMYEYVLYPYTVLMCVRTMYYCALLYFRSSCSYELLLDMSREFVKDEDVIRDNTATP